MKFVHAKRIHLPSGTANRLRYNGKVLWEHAFARYVSFGDSIAAGHTINADWAEDYGEGSQYGQNGRTQTAIVTGCYTDLIRNELSAKLGGHVATTSYARSGDKLEDLMEKLDHDGVRQSLEVADYVTICIGANSVLEPAMAHFEEYIVAGDSVIAEMEAEIESNLSVLADDSNPNGYTALFNKLYEINPDAQYVFTNLYNPYKYLWVDEGENGFFKPLLDTIPNIVMFGFDITAIIKDQFLKQDIIQLLFKRTNALSGWAEGFVTRLNTVIASKIDAYGKPNFKLADTKGLYDVFPDRPISATKHYNDLVNVEYTRGYDTSQMDWGQLWADSDAATFWLSLVSKYVSINGIDFGGFMGELLPQIVEKVILPDVDPHPEEYGQYVLKRTFSDALDIQALDYYQITYDANGGSGEMATQIIPTIDGLPSFITLLPNGFTAAEEGYYISGWNTEPDGSGIPYSLDMYVGIAGIHTLYAQWSNIYNVVYMHTNHTVIYTDDETGHMECYALYINGELKPKFGKFSESTPITYQVPYGSTVRVVVSNYNPDELLYDDVDCDVYFNGANVASGYRGTEYTFTLTQNVTVDFRWKIAGSLPTFDARSWEDCYITT